MNTFCSETQFITSSTITTWPSNQYWMNLAVQQGYDTDILAARGPEAELIKQELQQDYTKAEVYFQTLNVQSIVQRAKYTDEGFFAGLGGALSLYLGVAIIMVFELLEFFFDIFMNTWHFCTTKQVPKDLDG